MYLFGKGLARDLYYTIPPFKNPPKGSLLKTLRKKEKMLVTSIFSFSHSVFHPIKLSTDPHIFWFKFGQSKLLLLERIKPIFTQFWTSIDSKHLQAIKLICLENLKYVLESVEKIVQYELFL